MKKFSIIFAAVAVFSFSNLNLFAQNYKSTISVDAGASMVVTFYKAYVYTQENTSDNYDYSSLPVMQVTYDYMITDWLSAGVAGSYQQFKFTVPNEDILINIKRSNIALRGLFHYGKLDRIDMYSGIRLGFTFWNSDIDPDDPTIYIIEDSKYSDFTFSPQLIAFGIRGYFTDNIGAHIELAIGSPYFLAGGINFRF